MRSVAISVVAVATVLFGVSACDARDGDAATVTATSSGSPPGSPLFADLRTPQGTLLLGGVFPRPGGATAVMLLTGDPLVAFADLAGQAARAHLSLAPTSVAPC